MPAKRKQIAAEEKDTCPCTPFREGPKRKGREACTPFNDGVVRVERQSSEIEGSDN